MPSATKKMNHSEYPASLKNKTREQLLWIARDAREAIEANPENPNNSYYFDEINYCCNRLSELDKR